MSNVDHAEIAKFEALAHRWWDRESEFKPLHDINPLRVNWIDERVSLAGKKVLDVGCGGGILSEAMALRGATVTGIDMGEARWRSLNCTSWNPVCRSNTGRSLPKPWPKRCPSSSTWSPAWKCSNTFRTRPR
ncbi:Ubiquinone biosynthesis O-methyltransferase, mitochondrial [Pseudomonas sp. Teo4]|nr:Ubiquinone biosynthesis O-methyltransferase, mitochondrial [Pseudomonas sp. Teo4]